MRLDGLRLLGRPSAGSPVTLRPNPEAEASFGRWGGACSEAGSGPCQLVPESDAIEVLAAFRPDLRSPDLASLFVTVEGRRGW